VFSVHFPTRFKLIPLSSAAGSYQIDFNDGDHDTSTPATNLRPDPNVMGSIVSPEDIMRRVETALDHLRKFRKTVAMRASGTVPDSWTVQIWPPGAWHARRRRERVTGRSFSISDTEWLGPVAEDNFLSVEK
jgi:hypothetical protein